MNNEMTTDNMSNEEVIEVLKGIVFNGFDRTTRKERQALDLAIKALEERPQGDLISREALKKAIEQIAQDYVDDNFFWAKLFDLIDNAPTVEANSIIDGLNNEIDDLSENLAWYINERNRLLKERRPQGEWIIVKDKKWGDNVKCPFCEKELAGTDLNFCCKCGARLTGSEKMNRGAE